MVPFEHRGTVRWSETDASGRFHYTSAFIWAEEAEHALCRTLAADWRPNGMPRRTVSATFNAPFQAGESYVVRLTVARIGTTSVTFDWEIGNGTNVAVEGSHTVVHLGQDGRPQDLPFELRDGFGRHLKEQSHV
jgi:acyl-CoA thioester hydrolase